MRYEDGGPHPCNGDSGSGYFLDQQEGFTYLGVTWSGVHPLCEADDPASNPEFKPKASYVLAFRAVYQDLNVIEAATKYVAENPILQDEVVTQPSESLGTEAEKPDSGTEPQEVSQPEQLPLDGQLPTVAAAASLTLLFIVVLWIVALRRHQQT